jgi:hypothetical protein
MDFLGFPCRTLIEPVRVWLIGIPGTVEPVACGGDSRLEDTRHKTQDRRHKTEDEEGSAQIIGIDDHRDAATSDSFACRETWPMKSRILVLALVSWSLASSPGRMSRADCFGGAGMRRIVDWIFEIGDWGKIPEDG